MAETSLTTQAEALLDELPKPARKPIGDPSRLTRAEEALILKLNDDGKTQTEIAQLIGCSQPTVCRVIQDFGDTRQLAKRIAHNSAVKLTKRVVDDADVDQALEVLDRIGVLEKRQNDSGRGAQVNIVIGMPGQAAGPDPVITLSPSAFASDAPR